jgi:hypothetical protein
VNVLILYWSDPKHIIYDCLIVCGRACGSSQKSCLTSHKIMKLSSHYERPSWNISEVKQVTFLTTRTAWVTSEDWVKGCDWWKTSILLPVDVRVVKNVTCLSSLLDKFRSRTRTSKTTWKWHVVPMYGYATPFWRQFHVVFDVRVLDLNLPIILNPGRVQSLAESLDFYYIYFRSVDEEELDHENTMSILVGR